MKLRPYGGIEMNVLLLLLLLLREIRLIAILKSSALEKLAWVPCGRLSWPSIGFRVQDHTYRSLSYRVVSLSTVRLLKFVDGISSVMACLHGAIVAAIGRAISRATIVWL